MTNDVIIGFLSGSLATEMVREIFHFFTRGFDHRRELRKLTYERKLKKAEKATAFYITYYQRVLQVKHAYEVYIKELDDININTEAIENVIYNGEKIIEDLNHNKNLDIKSVYLYIETEDDGKAGEKYAAQTTKALNEVAKLEDEIKNLLELSGREDQTDDHATKCLVKIVGRMPELAKQLKILVRLLDKTLTNIDETIKSIKRQIKTYG